MHPKGIRRKVAMKLTEGQFDRAWSDVKQGTCSVCGVIREVHTTVLKGDLICSTCTLERIVTGLCFEDEDEED